MKKRFPLIFASISFLSIINAKSVSAQIINPAITAGSDTAGSEFISDVLTTFITALFIIGVVVFLFILAFGAYKWISASGDKTAVQKAKEHIEPVSFQEMNLIQKHKAIEKVIDAEIRKNLKKDGGDLEVVDMKEKNGDTIVYVRYLGACKGCPSSQTGTKEFIEGVLREKLDKRIAAVAL